eukprot:TRINITY_DN107805_c0_g1_i1.p1 TRINITY_DN107805_c0_g1~~TRINITY_DN107805_c0_g1_i1.p1  ORF type:complete len:104 (-),score=28.39 TRINITY_DN107805_c0_g1_i1:123-434(-)
MAQAKAKVTEVKGTRPITLVKPRLAKELEPRVQLETMKADSGQWFQDHATQILELRPSGWGALDFKSAVKLAKGEKVEAKDASPTMHGQASQAPQSLRPGGYR